MAEQTESAAVVCPDCGYGLRTLTVGCTCGWTPPKSETVEQTDVYAARYGWSKALAERDAARAECERLRAELAAAGRREERAETCVVVPDAALLKADIEQKMSAAYAAGQVACGHTVEPLTFGEWESELGESIDSHQRARLTFAAAARCCARRGIRRCRHVIPPLSDTEIKRLVDVARAVPSVPSDTRPGLHTVDMPGVVRAIVARDVRLVSLSVLPEGWRCPVCGGGLAPTTIRCPCTPSCPTIPMNACTGSVFYVRQPDATTEKREEHAT